MIGFNIFDVQPIFKIIDNEIIQHIAANNTEVINFNPCLSSVIIFKNKNMNKKDMIGIIYNAPTIAIDSNLITFSFKF